jgi:hypothetical protein
MNSWRGIASVYFMQRRYKQGRLGDARSTSELELSDGFYWRLIVAAGR